MTMSLNIKSETGGTRFTLTSTTSSISLPKDIQWLPPANQWVHMTFQSVGGDKRSIIEWKQPYG